MNKTKELFMWPVRRIVETIIVAAMCLCFLFAWIIDLFKSKVYTCGKGKILRYEDI